VIRPAPILLLTVLAMLLLSPTAMARNPAPEGRTYFIFIMGLEDDPYGIEADCLTFGANQACTPEGDICLDWQRTQGGVQTNKEGGFALHTQFDQEGLIIRMEGQGRIDSRGRKSSLSAVARAAALDVQLNFTFAGRQVKRSQCLRLAEEFRAQQSGP